MKRLTIVLITLFFTFELSAQYRLEQRVEENENNLVIPYSRYKLENGLSVIIHEDHSDPLVHVNITYNVGSANEEPGKSGFAHFFEHMMFQGSKHVEDEEHFKIINSAGGNLNGATTRDKTFYFETVPANYLKTVLWLESDRMGFMLDGITQKKFENQREVIKNEKRQRYMNRPYGMLPEIEVQSLYHTNHPYSWPTIGYLEDLDRATVEDVKAFFNKYYGPNNATITIVGDVETEKTIKLVNKYFGDIPSSGMISHPTPQKAILPSNRYVSFEDRVNFPMLKVIYPTIPGSHEDEPALDVLAHLIGGGQNSLLYKKFIKTEKANRAYSYHPTHDLAGEFEITIMANENANLQEIYSELNQAYKELERKLPTHQEIKSAVNSIISNKIFALESASGKAFLLSNYYRKYGYANMLHKDIQRYKEVTVQDVMTAYGKYIRGKNHLAVSVIPTGRPDLKAFEDNFTYSPQNIEGSTNNEVVEYRETKNKIFRWWGPGAGKTPSIKVPEYKAEKIPGDIRFRVIENDEVPVVNVFLTVDAGQVMEREPQMAGYSYFLARMLKESTKIHSSEEIDQMLDNLGSKIYINSTDYDIEITVRSLKENLRPTMDILQEMLFNPAFNHEDLDRIKREVSATLKNRQKQPAAIASDIFSSLLYGPMDPLGHSRYGEAQSLQAINVGELMMYYERFFNPSGANLVFAGDVSEKEASEFVHAFTQWGQNQHPVMPDMPPPPGMEEMPGSPEGHKPPEGHHPPDGHVPPGGQLPPPGKKGPSFVQQKAAIYFIDHPGATQSEIRVGYLAMPYDATGDYYKASVMNYPLGGNFNSRINLKLREEKGYTYGARSYFYGGEDKGPWIASSGVIAEKTDSALLALMDVIKNFRENKIDKKELKYTKKALAQKEVLSYETNLQKARMIEKITEFNLENDFPEKQREILKKLSKSDIRELAENNLPMEKMIILVVGDRGAVYEGLKKLPFGEVIELSKEGFKLMNN